MLALEVSGSEMNMRRHIGADSQSNSHANLKEVFRRNCKEF
jgi:hypothetical protein